jgi:DNA invertase Pin-like site-specific DNA recombinase
MRTSSNNVVTQQEAPQGQVIAYLRVSTDRQELNVQRLEILEYANRHNIKITDFMELEISSRKDVKQRRIDELIERLNTGDTLIVSELSRLGRSVGQVVNIVDELVRKHIRVIAIKESINIEPNGKKDMQTTVMVSMFSLFAEMERQLISERTRQGLNAARAKGKLLGRPVGSWSNSKLTGKDEAIREELRYGVAKAAIARKCGVSRTTLLNYIQTRKLIGL